MSSSNQDLILYEDDSNFYAQPVKIPHFKSLLTRKQARVHKHGDPIFLLHFFTGHIMFVKYATFQKKV